MENKNDRALKGKIIEAFGRINNYINENCLLLPKEKSETSDLLSMEEDMSSQSGEIDYAELFAQIAGEPQESVKKSLKPSDNYGRRMSKALSKQSKGNSVSVRRMTMSANTGTNAPKTENERQTIVMVSLMNEQEVAEAGNQQSKYRLIVRLLSECSVSKTEARYISSSKTKFSISDRFFSIECRPQIRSLQRHLYILNGNNQLYINDPVFRRSLFKKINTFRKRKVMDKQANLRMNEERRVKYLLLNGLVTPEMLRKQENFHEEPFIEVLQSKVVFVRNPLALTHRTLKGYKDLEYANIPRRTGSHEKMRAKTMSIYTKTKGPNSKSSVSSIEEVILEELSKSPEESTGKDFTNIAFRETPKLDEIRRSLKSSRSHKKENISKPEIKNLKYFCKDLETKSIANFDQESEMDKMFNIAEDIIE